MPASVDARATRRNAAGRAASDARRTLDPMDDERWEPGMPVLERQAVAERPGAATGPFGATPSRPASQGLPPRSVPEVEPDAAPEALRQPVGLVLICGAIAITALELGDAARQPARQAVRR